MRYALISVLCLACIQVLPPAGASDAGSCNGVSLQGPAQLAVLAGNTGSQGNIDAIARDARFQGLQGVAVDGSGNIYVADGDAVRKVTPAGAVTVLAGPAAGAIDGGGGVSALDGPTGVAVDGAGDVFVADTAHQVIREVTPWGEVSTFAGSLGVAGCTDSASADGGDSTATFNGPTGLAFDAAGNLYVADRGNHTLRRISLTGVVSTLAGNCTVPGNWDGVGGLASFSAPVAVALDAQENVWVADEGNANIRVVTPSGVVTTVAQNFSHPVGIAVDAAGLIYVADLGTDAIIRITPPSGDIAAMPTVAIFAGAAGMSGIDDGVGSAASFEAPRGLAFNTSGTLYVADGDVLRTIAPNAMVTTFAGTAATSGAVDGLGSAARFTSPAGASIDSSGNIYVADSNDDTIREVNDGVVTTIAGVAGQPGYVDGIASESLFSGPRDVAVGVAGVYVADTGNDVVRLLSTDGMVTTLAGLVAMPDGGEIPMFQAPSGVAVNDATGTVFVADTGNHCIRTIAPDGTVATFAGTPGSAGSADGSPGSFRSPTGVAVDQTGQVFVADTGNNTIREILPDGTVSTLAGSASNAGLVDGAGGMASFDAPRGIAVGASGVYVADTGNAAIRFVSPYGVVSTLAGVPGSIGISTGQLPASLFEPVGVAVMPTGQILIVDADAVLVTEPGCAPAPIVQAALNSGNGQTGPAGESLAAPFVVVVSDENGAAAPNVTVDWSSTAPGATLTSGGFAVTQTITDAYGRATALAALAPMPGPQVFQAALDGQSGASVVFVATANPLIANMSPNVTSAEGGVLVTVSGTGFESTGLTLTVDGQPASLQGPMTSTHLEFVAPAETSAGVRLVTVTSGGQSTSAQLLYGP